MSQQSDSNYFDSTAVEILLSLGSTEMPSVSYIAVSNRLGCTPELAVNIVKGLQERGLVELISNFDGSLSNGAIIRSSWRWETPAFEDYLG